MIISTNLAVDPVANHLIQEKDYHTRQRMHHLLGGYHIPTVRFGDHHTHSPNLALVGLDYILLEVGKVTGCTRGYLEAEGLGEVHSFAERRKKVVGLLDAPTFEYERGPRCSHSTCTA